MLRRASSLPVLNKFCVRQGSKRLGERRGGVGSEGGGGSSELNASAVFLSSRGMQRLPRVSGIVADVGIRSKRRVSNVYFICAETYQKTTAQPL